MSRAAEGSNRRMLRARDAMDRDYAKPLDIPALARNNSARFSGYVGKDLPKARAAMCPFEYRQELRSWRRLLSFWLSDQGGLRPESPPAAALVLTS
jgi:hypothetical protein